jgi:hypothetical protein
MIQIKNDPDQKPVSKFGRSENGDAVAGDAVRIACARSGLYRAEQGALSMTDEHETAIDAARHRLRTAEEKFDRQQRRYAMLALEGDKATAAARATLAEVEAELEASREAMRKLEADASGRG